MKGPRHVTDRPGGKEPAQDNEFARQADQRPPGILREFVDFLMHSKKWWLAPILFMLLLLGLLIFFGGTVAAPFIYPLF